VSVQFAECWCVHYCGGNGDEGCTPSCSPHSHCPSCVDCPGCDECVPQQCGAQDDENAPPCERTPTVVDEQRNGYCDLHAYLAAVSGQLTYPINASEHERARFRRDVNETAKAMLAALAQDDPEAPF
jgi:hypothetical protein